MDKVYINCSGRLTTYNSKEEAMNFYEDCIRMSEGAEQTRYVKIYFSVKDNLNTNRRCFTDGTSYVYDSDIEPDGIELKELWLLNKYYNITKNDLLFFKADRYLRQSHNKISGDNINEIYTDYIIKHGGSSFYFRDNNKIVCIDSTAKFLDNYWVEEFDLQDYEYADKWLKHEIKYEDYLEFKNDTKKYTGEGMCL